MLLSYPRAVISDNIASLEVSAGVDTQKEVLYLYRHRWHDRQRKERRAGVLIGRQQGKHYEDLLSYAFLFRFHWWRVAASKSCV